MPHDPCIGAAIQIDGPRAAKMDHSEAAGINRLISSVTFFQSYFSEGRYWNLLSVFDNMVFLWKTKNTDKHIVLGDLPTLFLAALVFHVWKWEFNETCYVDEYRN